MQGLIDFARGSYNALIFDLSGNMEQHSLQVMQESKRVFVVCNPEPCSMFLGREKIAFLKTLGLGDRVSVIVNRADQVLAVPLEKVANLMGVPIAARFSEDGFWVNVAVEGARAVVGDEKTKHSRLVPEYRAFAQFLMAGPREKAAGDGTDAPAKMLAVA